LPAYLGSITDSAMKIDVQRRHFWDHVSARLDALGNRITPTDRKKVETAIAEKVAGLTPAQYKNAARKSARLLGWSGSQQRAALQDEAEQYQGNGGELVQQIKTALQRTVNGKVSHVGSCDSRGNRATELSPVFT
jgi:hypothetical protein